MLEFVVGEILFDCHDLFLKQSRIFMDDHIPISSDRSLLGRQTSKWYLWDVVFHENNYQSSKFNFLYMRMPYMLYRKYNQIDTSYD